MTQAAEQISRQFANASVNKKNWGEIAYNALSEGLVGDGIRNDTAALQALVNKAISEGRRTILLPHGNYYVTALANGNQVDFVGDNSSFVGGYAGKITNLGSVATLQADVTYKKVSLTEQGLTGDGVFRSIATVFPSVTLGQVQELNPSATLGNSADWYILQKLVNTSANEIEIIIDGNFVLDLAVVISRSNITIRGKTRNSNSNALTSPNKEYWILQQIGINQNIFTIQAGSNTHDITFKDFWAYGKLNNDSTKTGHGIEIVKTVGSGGLANLTIDHCKFTLCGGSGLYRTSGHIANLVITKSAFSSNYDNGIHFSHDDNNQCNYIRITHSETGSNGFIYNGSQYVNSPTFLSTRGHGISLSGTSIVVESIEASINAGAAVMINTGFCNGITIVGNYSESNKLADIYVSSGYKKSLHIKGNYTASASANNGRIYFSDPSFSYAEIPDKSIVIGRYVHSVNLEVHNTSLDIATGTFTKNGHGLSTGNNIYPIPNGNSGAIYPINVYPGGMTKKNYPGYYVVNATANTYQISTTSGGSAITFSANPNMDLTKWHFERSTTPTVTISNLPPITKCRVIVRGQILQGDAQSYIVGSGSTFLSESSGTYGIAQGSIFGDIDNYGEILIDYTVRGYVRIDALIMSSGTTSSNTPYENHRKYFDRNSAKYGVPFTVLNLEQWTVANGFVVEVFQD